MDRPTAQGTHVYVLTLQNSQHSACTVSGTYTPSPGVTRYDALTQLRIDVVRQYPSMEGAVVLYFALEPNHLTPAEEVAR
ncbi:hypothetical protein [Streptomyces sp. S1]|uniref:hypothetical protein n=1 Tax=Streptomyces sp. S1 TaxID=718288 RepID=UPI000EF79431|nr:hypothetical protein [Streptomyces sp. S1]